MKIYIVGALLPLLLVFLCEPSTLAEALNNGNIYATTPQYRFRYFIRNEPATIPETAKTLRSLTNNAFRDLRLPVASKMNDNDFQSSDSNFSSLNLTTTTTTTTTPKVDPTVNSIAVDISPSSVGNTIVNPLPVMVDSLTKYSQNDEFSQPQFEVQKPLPFGIYRTGLSPPKKTIVTIDTKPLPTDDISAYRKHEITTVAHQQLQQQPNNNVLNIHDGNGRINYDKTSSSSTKSVQVELNYKDESAPEKQDYIVNPELPKYLSPFNNNYFATTTAITAGPIISDIKNQGYNAVDKNRHNPILNHNLPFYANQKTPFLSSSLNTIAAAATPTTITDDNSNVRDIAKPWWWWQPFDSTRLAASVQPSPTIPYHRLQPINPTVMAPPVTPHGQSMILPASQLLQRNSIITTNGTNYYKPISPYQLQQLQQQQVQNQYFQPPPMFELFKTAEQQLFIPVLMPPPAAAAILPYGVASPQQATSKLSLSSPISTNGNQCEKPNYYHWNPSSTPYKQPPGVVGFLLNTGLDFFFFLIYIIS